MASASHSIIGGAMAVVLVLCVAFAAFSARPACAADVDTQLLKSVVKALNAASAASYDGRKLKQAQPQTLYYCSVGEVNCNPPSTVMFPFQPAGVHCSAHKADPIILLTMLTTIKSDPNSIVVAGGQAGVRLELLCCDQACSDCSSAGLIEDCGCGDSEFKVFSAAECKEQNNITRICAGDYSNDPNAADTSLIVSEALAGVGSQPSC